MIELRVATTDADYASWAAIKTAVIPDEPTTAEQLRASDEDARLLLLAAVDGVDAGCGVGNQSGFAGLAFFGVRVLHTHRGNGVCHELVRALCDHARALGRDGVNAFCDVTEPESIAVAEHYGLREVDYQLLQERAIGDEPPPPALAGIQLVPLGARREELLRAAWPVAQEGYADLPLPGAVSYPLATFLRDEATLPHGSFVALELGEVVGYAGLCAPGEHGLTVVRRDRRGRGIARALKRAQLHWAAANGIGTLVTWTQKGNEAMQALNRSLGYADRSKVLTMQGPLPL